MDRRRPERKETPREERAIILDYLPNGYPLADVPSFRKRPIAQAVGTRFFTLLELSPKKDVTITLGEEVYIGSEDRPKVEVIIGRIHYAKLTATARSELEHILRGMVEQDEERFVEFFNRAGPLSMRMHSIELIPGIGKKVMWDLIEARKEKLFDNFEDLYARVEHLPELHTAILKRILQELEGKDKHKLFTK